MNSMKFGFIGTGNMGGALASAVASQNAENTFLSDRSEERVRELAGKLGCRASDNKCIAEGCRFIVLGVKPQVLADMLSEIAPVLACRKDRFVLVSMAAGQPISKICTLAGGEYPVIRIMPNTPAAIGKGMLLCAANDKVTDGELEDFKAAFSAAGRLDFINEALIDAGSAVSGCGPAFVYMFIEALADGAVECGLPRAKALEYAAQTLAGSAELLLSSGKHPGELKDAVCSPAGSTIAGVHALENGGFRSLAISAVTESYKRTLELGK